MRSKSGGGGGYGKTRKRRTNAGIEQELVLELELELEQGDEVAAEREPTPEERLTGTVTSVERHPRRAGRYKLHVNDKWAIDVQEDVLLKHGLWKGLEIDATTAAVVVEDVGRHAAWSDAVIYIGRKPCAIREVKLYLKRKGYEQPLIQYAVDRLIESGYADDAAFASQFAEHRIRSDRKGRRWVQQELQQKGVKRETVQEALAGIDPEEELNAARELAAKRWVLMKGATLDKRRKLMAFLLRRGYPGGMVNGIVRELAASDQQPDDFDEEVWVEEGDLDH
ncbi:regulatory protein RecX [Paenibacillus koleovorans]|uniref:regulatory protein RecX n=1 Tax=Paenibacillus koleovorans TaxID=121608 RepID=UPI000FD9CB96|nr:regulatory protein RecX [Paenibacillus koleovorans]